MEPNQAQDTNKLLVPAAIIIAGALIAGAIYAGGGKSSNSGDLVTETKIVPVSSEDHILGSPDAEVVIIEYSDTECPFCKIFHNTMKQVMSQYEGRVAWVYRHLPIPQLHALAAKEAEATECVAEFGGNQAFWQYLDKIFLTTNSGDTLDPAELPKLAISVGIDGAKFNECLSSGKYTDAVEESAAEGYAAGARGTPYSLVMVDGEVRATINGADPLATVKMKLDAILK